LAAAAAEWAQAREEKRRNTALSKAVTIREKGKHVTSDASQRSRPETKKANGDRSNRGEKAPKATFSKKQEFQVIQDKAMVIGDDQRLTTKERNR
jgi:hypothetical protein